MDVISLSKAKKAKEPIAKLRSRLGLDGSENGENVIDQYNNVKERLVALEEKTPGEVLHHRISELENHTNINLNKFNLHISGLLNKQRYELHEMIVDDFEDDSGIDSNKSLGYVHDAESRKLAVDALSEQAEIVTVAEKTGSDPTYISLSQESNEKLIVEKLFDLESGIFYNTELIDGMLSLKSNKVDTFNIYEKEGYYETPILDLSENFKEIRQLTHDIQIPEGTSVSILSSTSSDGIDFTDYQSVAEDGTVLSPSARYIRIKIQLFSFEELVEKEIYTFDSESVSQFEVNSKIQLNGSVSLKKDYTLTMNPDINYLEAGTVLRKTISPSEWRSINQIRI